MTREFDPESSREGKIREIHAYRKGKSTGEVRSKREEKTIP